MLKQFSEIKDKYEDCILFYRLGDFYEMFGPDAQTASKVLEITLTSREAGNNQRVPMCGIPHHSAESYLNRLVNNGYKVAICEQVEDPKAVKGIVRREVIRVVTPGTILPNSILDEKTSNYLMSIVEGKEGFGVALVDASTGAFWTSEFTDQRALEYLKNEIAINNPAEIITSTEQNIKTLFEDGNFESSGLNFSSFHSWAFRYDHARKVLLEHFNVQSLVGYGCENLFLATQAAGAIIEYLKDTQKTSPINITSLSTHLRTGAMALDAMTKRNLELTQTIHYGEKSGSLFHLLDKSKTALGSRLLKQWLDRPLIDKEKIKTRLNSVEELVNELMLRQELQELLAEVYDMERLLGRIAYGTCNARDLIALKASLKVLPAMKKALSSTTTHLLKDIVENFDTLEDIADLLERAITQDPPFQLKEGGLIRTGYHEVVDELRTIKNNGKSWIAGLELKEKEKTGIKSLKIGFNKVFGYYLEVTKSNIHLVPQDYLRKQTLANGERYITPELKDLESKVLGAEEKLSLLEYELFEEIRTQISLQSQRIQRTSQHVSLIDCLQSLAEVAVVNKYCKPEFTDEDILHFEDLRHPVVEKMLKDCGFVPNDLYFNNSTNRFYIITGPNMAGKSTFCRSVAVGIVLAQMGSYVPAKRAKLGITDRVFARVGASDDLRTGQSTFMLEMNEVASIINHATSKSFVILDEVGRGTSTYDGLSIAWSLSEYIHKNIGAKTIFATHYHELVKLEEEHLGIKNLSVAVKEQGDNIFFLRKIISGGADRSYGIHVARLAGLPNSIIRRANEILYELENNTLQDQFVLLPQQLAFVHEEIEYPATKELIDELGKININTLTPLEALNILNQLIVKSRIINIAAK